MELEFERTDRAIERVLQGDHLAHPLAARLHKGLRVEVPSVVEAAHLAAIATLGGREPSPLTASPHSRRPRRALVSLLAAALILVLGASTALAASDGATPGSPLYGLKRAAERLSLAMHRSPSSRAAFHLHLADRRLAEIQAMLQSGRDASAVDRDLTEELELAQHEAERALALGQNDDALMAHVQAELEKHLERLNALLLTVPEAARSGIANAIEHATHARDQVQHGRREHQKDKENLAPSPNPSPSHDKATNGKNRGNHGNSSGRGQPNPSGSPDSATSHRP